MVKPIAAVIAANLSIKDVLFVLRRRRLMYIANWPGRDLATDKNVILLLLLSAAPLRVATADISAQKIWQCFTPDALPDATY